VKLYVVKKRRAFGKRSFRHEGVSFLDRANPSGIRPSQTTLTRHCQRRSQGNESLRVTEIALDSSPKNARWHG
jgi:hypothetical protein